MSKKTMKCKNCGACDSYSEPGITFGAATTN